MSDSLFILQTLTDLYSQKIQTYHQAAIQFDDVLLQLRVLSLIIVVGVATLGGTIRSGLRKHVLASAILLAIIVLLFGYDLYTYDQQMRRNTTAAKIENQMLKLTELSFDNLIVHAPPKAEELDEWLSKTGCERWMHRLSISGAWQWTWYAAMCLLGLVLLNAKSWFVE